jgi:hypothetical protein
MYEVVQGLIRPTVLKRIHGEVEFCPGSRPHLAVRARCKATIHDQAAAGNRGMSSNELYMYTSNS